MSRLPHKPEVIRRLFALSGNQCAFPGCPNRLITDTGNFIAQICHIEAANGGGERYNTGQNDEDRRSFDNLMLLCYEHHIETNDEKRYPPELLRKMKADHEKSFVKEPYEIPENYFTNVISQFENKLDAILGIANDSNAKITEFLRRQEEMNDTLKSSLAGLSFDGEKMYISQLDSIKELKKKHKYRTVIELLIDFRCKNWNKLTPELKYKVIVNLGVTYFDLQEKQNASNSFLELKEINYETEDSISFLTLGYAFINDKTQFNIYFNKGKILNPENVNLWLAFIYRYAKEMSLADLIQNLPPSLLKKPEVLFNLGEVAHEKGNEEECLSYLRKALGLLASTDEDKITDAKAIIASRILSYTITPFKFIYQHFSLQEIENIREATILLTEAWNSIRNTELASSRWFIIMNRGVSYKMAGSLDKALQDFEKAYEISRQFLALKNLVLLYMQLDKYTMADELLIKALSGTDLSETQHFEIDSIKARLFILKGNVQEGVNILLKWLDENQRERYFEILMLIINTYFEKGLLEEAQAYCKQLKETFPEKIHSYLVAGYFFYRKEQYEKALENYTYADSLTNETTSMEIIHSIANAYREIKQYKKAATLFERIVDHNILNDISRDLIQCCYYSGDFQLALSLASGLFDKNPQQPFLAEIIINIHKDTNNYLAGIKIAEQYLTVAPINVKDTFLYKTVVLYYHLRNWNKVKEYVLKIKDPLSFPRDDCFNIAYFLIKSKEVKRGLDVAFDARVKFYLDSQTHARYINISVNAESEYKRDMFPQTVQEECAVFLQNEAGKEDVFLISNKPAIADNVLLPTEDFSKQLLGKSLNENIVIEKVFGIKHSFLITKIMDKYVYAFRKSLKFFETKFTGKENITVLKTNPGQPDDEMIPFIRGIASQRKWYEKQVYEMYNQRLMTIGTLAGLFKQNPVKQWFNMITTDEVFLYSYLHDELPFVEESINKIIILDLTSLLTAFFLYPEHILFEHISASFIVSQLVIAELEDVYDELEAYTKDGRLSVNYEDGHLVGHFTERENMQKHRSTLENIIQWCKEHAQIKTSSINLQLNRESRKQVEKTLGESFYDTIQLALALL